MGTEDQEVTQIARQLEGITISVTARRPRAGSAPPAQASSYPASQTAPVQSSVSPGVGRTPVEVASSPSTTPAARPTSLHSPVSAGVGRTPVEVAPPQPQPSPPGGTRARLEASFPPVPVSWSSQASLLRSSVSSGEARLLRAWVAGCWARAVLRGDVPSPNHPPRLSIPNRPALYRSRPAYLTAVNSFQDRVSVSQGFPSEIEARVYLDAALQGSQPAQRNDGL